MILLENWETYKYSIRFQKIFYWKTAKQSTFCYLVIFVNFGILKIFTY